jgi:phosphatidylserine/phosphatidylglycerophosphate/cardiolipin synthase-like enzyme
LFLFSKKGRSKKHLETIMKKILFYTIFLLLFSFPLHATDVSLNNTTAHVYFSPDGGCTNAIIKEISKAKSEILIQAYSFTSKPIAQAILGAKKAGIHVEIILDKSNKSAKYSAGDFTAHMGIPTYIDSEHTIAHNKIIIIDKETVITGSFNFSKAAEEKNAENLLILKSKALANIYLNNWQEHKKHSTLYQGK